MGPARPRRPVVPKLRSLEDATPNPRTKRAERQTNRKNTGCPTCGPNATIEDDGEGHMVCKTCFTQVSESNIVADVTFQEDSRGAATVQGAYVGEKARHARSSAAQRRIGGSESNSLQVMEANGRRALGSLCPKLGIPESISNQALQIYTLAASNSFSTGRRTDEVIAACLYAACRRQKENAILIIDIAELQRINVYRLGEVYKSLCRELYLGQEGGVGTQYLVEVEALVLRYCRRLEFEPHTREVAADTLRIIRRMKRDYISTGRHPAGLCGAAIILAARMNNFRRSVREVVYVAKVCDLTIAKRVEEFRRTKSAALTVDQFREFGVRLKQQHDPPVLYESQLKEQRFEEKKRKRQAASEARDVIEISDDDSNAPSREVSVASPAPTPDSAAAEGSQRKRRRTSTEHPATPAPTQQELRRDSDGFLVPPLPLDPAVGSEEESDAARPKRGRPKKMPPEPILITDEELATEAELELDINEALNDQDIVDSRNELEKAKDEERAKDLAEQKKKADAETARSRREAEGVTWLDRSQLSAREEISSDDLEAAFADDPEVQNCVLSQAEQQIKEQIWIRENEDWLRTQHEKALNNIVKSANRKPKSGKKKSGTWQRKKKGKMGDGTTLAETTTPIETPADAVAAMLDVRAPVQSKFINYDMLRKVYEQKSTSPSASASRQSTTPSASGAGGDGSPSIVDRTDIQARESASPTRAASRTRGVGFESPPQTQTVASAPAVSISAARRPGDGAAPLSPPPTQTQVHAGADDESEGDPDDYVQDDADEESQDGTPFGWEGEDDREDIGEDDYHRAIDPTGQIAMEDTFGGEEYY